MTFTFLLTLPKLEIACLAGGGPLHLTKKLILENNRKALSSKEKGEREDQTGTQGRHLLVLVQWAHTADDSYECNHPQNWEPI